MNNSEVKFADTVQLVSITDLDGVITYGGCAPISAKSPKLACRP